MYHYLALLNIFAIQDMLEILFFSAIVFSFVKWLKQDQHTNLLTYFYLGACILVSAYFLDLQNIVLFYSASWPIMVLIFIVIHQKSLQKNYVAARTLIPNKKIDQTTWLTLTMSALFKSLQHKKNTIFVIEGNDSLDEFIHQPITVNSPIQKQLLDMIIESSTLLTDHIILLSQYGKLIALNGTWQKDIDPLWLDKKHESYLPWEQEALYWSTYLDALIFNADSLTKKITIIAHGTRITHLTSDKAINVIEQFLRKNLSTTKLQEIQKNQTEGAAQ